MKLNIALFAGHSRGASDPRQVEEHMQVWPAYLVAKRLLREAHLKIIDGEGHLLDHPPVYDLGNDEALRLKVELANIKDADVAIEMHLNRAAPMPKNPYGVSLYWESALALDTPHYWSIEGKALADCIQDGARGLYGFSQKKAKGQHWPRTGSKYFLSFTDMPAVITEVGFVEQYIDPVRHGAAVAGGILRYLEKPREL